MKESVASYYVYKGVRNENTAKQKSVGKTAALMEIVKKHPFHGEDYALKWYRKGIGNFYKSALNGRPVMIFGIGNIFFQIFQGGVIVGVLAAEAFFYNVPVRSRTGNRTSRFFSGYDLVKNNPEILQDFSQRKTAAGRNRYEVQKFNGTGIGDKNVAWF